MTSDPLIELAQRFQRGELPLDAFLATLRGVEHVPQHGVALDIERQRRCGYPEVIYGPGKTPDQLVAIVERLSAHGQAVLVTRLEAAQAERLRGEFPDGIHHPVARTFRRTAEGTTDQTPLQGYVPVVSAGTSDLPVAEEACETLRWMNVRCQLIADVGVAGPHRLAERLEAFTAADAVVVVAGMEGALPSVVGGYVACPVFAVPTSVGYGAALGGFAALLGMLNSCAANVAVVNIDAGFKAAYLAGMVARKRRA